MKSPQLRFFGIFLLILAMTGCGSREKSSENAPTLLPFTTREMKTAGFWISKYPSPDQIILTPQDIQTFNQDIQKKLKFTKDLAQLRVFSGRDLKNSLEKTWQDFAKGRYFFKNGRTANGYFYQTIKNNLNLRNIPFSVEPRYGFIVHFADQRFFPTAEGLFEVKGDQDFDELQNSDLDAGIPVVILHESQDKKWLYAVSEISEGWVEKGKVAFCPFEEFRRYSLMQPFIVTTSAKADIFLDSNLTKHFDYVRMGMKFPLVAQENSIGFQIVIPYRKENGVSDFAKAFIKREDAHEGYLDYSVRHSLEQAFKLLNEPYGWGGMYGEQDCSRFLIEVFSTFGVVLPRDSKNQAQVGKVLAKFQEKTTEKQKLEALKKDAIGGVTLLTMKGHIMLFLGFVDNRPYAIHASSAYRERIGSKDIVRLLNRVAVSDLSLGKRTKKRSWFERLQSLVLIGK